MKREREGEGRGEPLATKNEYAPHLLVAADPSRSDMQMAAARNCGFSLRVRRPSKLARAHGCHDTRRVRRHSEGGQEIGHGTMNLESYGKRQRGG